MSETNVKLATDLTVDLCRHFEGFVSEPYLCPANYWTQGYGTVNRPDGRRVSPNDPAISRETALSWLISEIRREYMPGVLNSSPHLINHPYVLAAMTDFAYNLGVPRYRASTLKTKINQRDWAESKLQLLRWTRGGGKVLPGLVRRRQAEANLY